MRPSDRLRAERRFWGYAWIAINLVTMVGIGILIPVFSRTAEVAGVPRQIRVAFYVVAVLAMANAIRRIVLQWLRLRRLSGEGGEDTG
ncbi:MAG TPA: hypothetical protein VMS93_13255 [Candidatus Saccharimonadales bacterium]|nr:hypothetical protein [Candidatus Saccharimonadales bacterium]